ncbi:putative RNA methyltransferase [Nonomuraea longicatena]|uniref:rRNA (Guanine-N1)-methyltransferase n=1 Tax=Nonomuraea longicatena TaxID=83682 RepID=A0ABN1PWT0_9ACTN
MLSDVVHLLVCPICGQGLETVPGALRCGRGHAFDLARQGYASLLVGSGTPGTADTAEMVAARERFLGAGHYEPLAAELARESAGARVVVEAGAGTGYYLARALGPEAVGLAFDISKFAIRRAARAHPRAGAVVADVWRPLPIADGVADVVLDVFAPRNGPEFARILRTGGRLVVVTPGPGHLRPLVEGLGLLSVDQDKEQRVARSLREFSLVERRAVEFTMELDADGVTEVVRMGPSAWHMPEATLNARISRVFEQETTKKVTTTASFQLSIFQTASRARVVP